MTRPHGTGKKYLENGTANMVLLAIKQRWGF